MTLSGADYDEIDKLRGQMMVLIRDMMLFCERYGIKEPKWLDDITLTAQDFGDELDRRREAKATLPVEDKADTQPIRPARRSRRKKE